MPLKVILFNVQEAEFGSRMEQVYNKRMEEQVSIIDCVRFKLHNIHKMYLLGT